MRQAKAGHAIPRAGFTHPAGKAAKLACASLLGIARISRQSRFSRVGLDSAWGPASPCANWQPLCTAVRLLQDSAICGHATLCQPGRCRQTAQHAYRNPGPHQCSQLARSPSPAGIGNNDRETGVGRLVSRHCRFKPPFPQALAPTIAGNRACGTTLPLP